MADSAGLESTYIGGITRSGRYFFSSADARDALGVSAAAAKVAHAHRSAVLLAGAKSGSGGPRQGLEDHRQRERGARPVIPFDYNHRVACRGVVDRRCAGRAGPSDQPCAGGDLQASGARRFACPAGRHGALQAGAPAARAAMEDIDLVQTTAQPAGPMMNALREVLEPWLVKPKWKQREDESRSVSATRQRACRPCRCGSRSRPTPREHFSLYGLRKAPFKVAARWFEGSCDIQTYELDELLGTKLRALYHRKQARDLFDLEIVLARLPVEPQRIVAAFLEYMSREGHPIARAQVERTSHLRCAAGRSWPTSARFSRPAKRGIPSPPRLSFQSGWSAFFLAIRGRAER